MEVEVAEIDFGGGRDGIVPVGSYLNDAAKRMGVTAVTCTSEEHGCAFEIEEGADLLSPVSDDEKEHLDKLGRNSKSRLGCYAQIQKPGVIVVMAKKEAEAATESQTQDDRNEKYRKEFGELPLEKKIANLVQLEAITISETLSYVMNAPYTVFDKIGDVLAEFGFKKEEAEKAAARPGKTSAGKAKPAASPKKETPPVAEV
jgi:ferredoxin